MCTCIFCVVFFLVLCFFIVLFMYMLSHFFCTATSENSIVVNNNNNNNNNINCADSFVGVTMGILYLHYIRRLFKIIPSIVKPTFHYIPPFFENIVEPRVFKHLSFSIVSFLGLATHSLSLLPICLMQAEAE
jgi:uncharacterized membrane protein